MKRMRWSLGTLAVLALVWATACESGGGGSNGPGGPGDLQRMQAGLVAFEGCGELENYLDEVLIAEVDEAIRMYQECQADNEGCYWYAYDVAVGAPGGRGDMGMDDGATGGGALPPGDPAAGGDGAPSGDQGGNGGEGGFSGGDGEEPRSDTNTQEEGVDEADIVKSDGEFLYILNGNRLRIVRSTPAEEMDLVGSAELGGSPIEMFLAGDRLAVFAYEYRYDYGGGYDGGYGGEKPVPADAGMPEPDAAPAEPSDDEPESETPSGPVADAIAGLQGELLTITLFDVSDRANPQVVRQTYLEGGYVDSRMVGTKAHIVVRAYPQVPPFDWYRYVEDDGTSGGDAGGGGSVGGSDGGTGISVDAGGPTEPWDAGSSDPDPEWDAGSSDPAPPSEDAGSYEERQEALTVDLEQAREDYLALLAETELEDMMPQRVDVVDGAPQTSLLVPCETFYRPSVSMGLNILAVVTIDLGSDDAAQTATGILGSSDTVYASAETLYVATYVYDYWMWTRAALESPEDVTERTAVHAFSIAGTPAYLASGFVEGQVLNQFSMSEWEGHLRLATTVRNWQRWEPVWDSADVAPEPQDATDNLVTILARQEDQLVQTGLLRDLGKPNESIFAARFFGPLGYVVTFEQKDPLYVIDVSDPTAPTKRGALEVPGYSSYIHPLGDEHLLTIGRGSTDPNNPEGTDGLKLSVYDVSDPDDPREVESEVSPAYSEAEYEHKAFTFYEHLNLLAIPIGSYWWDGQGEAPLDGLAIFRIDAATGIETVGSISHADLVPDPTGDSYCGYWMPQVRRGVFVGERVYSISDVGVKVNEATEGLAELNAVAFPNDGGWYGGGPYYGGGWGDCYARPTDDEPMPGEDGGMDGAETP